MSRQDQDRCAEVLREVRELRKSVLEETATDNVLDKDFIYFVVSMFVPVGYGETDLIPHDSIAHPIVGWICWLIPVGMLIRILWHLMAKRGWSNITKGLMAAILSIGFAIAVFFALRSFLDRRTKEVEEEVARNLTPHVLPPLTENVMESVFSITNGSSRSTISGPLYCGINQILGEKNGTQIRIGTLNSSAIPNASRLVPGDSRSEPCLMIWSSMVEKTSCIDMNLWLRYGVEGQPSKSVEKLFRLVGYQARGGAFNWYPEPGGAEIDYCDYFRRQTAPPSS